MSESALFHLTPGEWAGVVDGGDDRAAGLGWWQDVADTLPADVLAAIVDGLTPEQRPVGRWRPVAQRSRYALDQTARVLAALAAAARPTTTADVIGAVGGGYAQTIRALQGVPRG